MRRLCTVVFLLGLLGLLVMPVAPAGADPIDEPESIPTACHIGAPNVTVGDRVRLRIEVSSNSNIPEVGTVELAISTASARQSARLAARGVVWTKTIRYEGTPVVVAGPKLPRGQYRVTMAFEPDNEAFIPCHNAARFRVGAGGDTGGEDDDNPNLPNTGGPERWPLFVGLALLVAGSGLVGGSRRFRGAAHVTGSHRTALP